MSFPTPRLARSRRAAAVAALLALTLTPFSALAGPITFDAAPRSVVAGAVDLLDAWWRVIADVFEGRAWSVSLRPTRALSTVQDKNGPACDPNGGR